VSGAKTIQAWQERRRIEETMEGWREWRRVGGRGGGGRGGGLEGVGGDVLVR
jgi:hypothetical protein